MITKSDLQELLMYQPEHDVLSIYLNTDPAEGNVEVHKLRLRSMMKEVNRPEDEAVIKQFIEHKFDWTGRSIAIFSCAEKDFLRTYTLAVPVRNRVRLSNRPYVKPLANIIDSYGGYGVALVDQQSIRLFYFHLGELREQSVSTGESVRRVKRGGGSQAAGRRGGTAGRTIHGNEVTERNIKDAAQTAVNFFSENDVRLVLIGGTSDNVSSFQGQLPKKWQSLIAGTFPISMNAGKQEILERALRIGHEVEQRREAKLVNTVVTRAAKDQGAVVRLDDTLSAVHEGRVQILLIRDGFRSPGFRCKSCQYITSQQVDQCPFCSGEFEKIPDAVESAVRRVMKTGSDVEVLDADRDFGTFENIGAILRY